ncbi:hypothetical protein RRG08_015428 [Elysia crispata]|uniref:Uncharacterized protein n=1 Tax=Elysia crispata TaxID=231223 RepID=A0AAE0YHM0_9GAST|nr:hypothetical protein RRG08_015428 [Elysia crispata]
MPQHGWVRGQPGVQRERTWSRPGRKAGGPSALGSLWSARPGRMVSPCAYDNELSLADSGDSRKFHPEWDVSQVDCSASQKQDRSPPPHKHYPGILGSVSW